MTNLHLQLLLSALLLTAVSCQSHETTPPTPAAATEAVEPAPAATPSAEEVRYEAAYPTDVDPDGLTEEDVVQQESHDDDSHPHGDGEHSHGDDSHTHDPGEDESGHGH